MAANEQQRKTPPRDNLVRGVFPADVEIRDASEGEQSPTLFGHFAVFDTWTEINGWEGNFLERIAPGAFKKTMSENRDGMRVLLNHGQDPQLGDKPIAAIRDLGEDATGAYYEADLFKSVPELVVDGLRAKQYGASFRFQVVREEIDDFPDPSDYNPKGLPERTIKETRVMEFGPVTFGAYPEATSGVRSLTERFMAGTLADWERSPAVSGLPVVSSDLAERIHPIAAGSGSTGFAVSTSSGGGGNFNITTTTTTATEAAPSHPAPEEPRRDTQPEPTAAPPNTSKEEKKMASIDEMRARQGEIQRELRDIATENTGSMLDGPTQSRWDNLTAENDALETGLAAEEHRQSYLAKLAGDQSGQFVDGDAGTTRSNPGNGIPLRTGTDTYVTARAGRDKAPDDVFDMSSYHSRANSTEQLGRVYNDGAKRALETFHFPASDDQDAARQDMERLLRQNDSQVREIEQRYLIFGSPAYRSAFWKSLGGKPLSRDEQQALAAGAALEARSVTTSTTGGVTVPVQIDPTILLSGAGALNPFRPISRNIQTTSHQWQGVTSTGITATYRAEGATMADNSPSLVAPTITPERCDAFVPFSWEAASDWGGLEADMGRLFADAKNTAEATKFSVGAGHSSNEPKGVLVAAGTVVGSAAATAFSVSDVYALEDALPVRFQANASWLATTGMYQKIRQFDTQGGANLWVQLQGGNPAELIGYPAYKASTVGTAGKNLTSTARWGVIGDFSYYAIVDRIGFQVRYIDNLFAGNTASAISYPNGMSGVVAYWRNSADVLTSNAFRVGTIT